MRKSETKKGKFNGGYCMATMSGSLISSDERAELGTGAMIIFIAMVLAACVVGSVILSATEMMLSSQNNDAHSTTEPFTSIPVILRLEVVQLGPTDEFDLHFELPFLKAALPDTDMSWVVMCLPAGENRVQFDSGGFIGATPLDGDGNTGGTISEFDPGDPYRLRISLDTCDIENLDHPKGTLVLMVDNGRTIEKTLDFTSGVFVGKDMM